MFDLGNAWENQLIDYFPENKYYSASDKIDIHDKNNTKVIIANRVEKGATCLDVGCGVGYLGEILKEHRSAKVYGIDIDKKAVEYANKSGVFEKVYNFSVSERAGKEYDEFIKDDLKFDYIMFADVLEHVVNAEDLLMFFSKFLKKNGKILVSLPNVAHFDIVRGLINGEFNYNHIGLLDNTHLRFYTKSSFKQFIQQVNEVYKQNFLLKEIGRTIVEPEYIKNYPNMHEILDKKGEACVLQYVYEISVSEQKVKKTAMKKDVTFDELEQILNEAKITKAEKDKLSARVVELEKAIDDIYKSKSWKMTRPVRGAATLINKVRRK